MHIRDVQEISQMFNYCSKTQWCTNMPACVYNCMNTVGYIPNKKSLTCTLGMCRSLNIYLLGQCIYVNIMTFSNNLLIVEILPYVIKLWLFPTNNFVAKKKKKVGVKTRRKLVTRGRIHLTEFRTSIFLMFIPDLLIFSFSVVSVYSCTDSMWFTSSYSRCLKVA